jgi:hypothetical protein
MALPEKYHLDQVRKLRGDAQVTHPDGTLAVVKVERVQTVPRGTPEPAFLSADVEYPTAKLIEQTIVGGDANQVEVYRIWQTLPGGEVVRWTVDEETQVPVKITTQLVQTPASPIVAAAGTQVEFVPINAVHGTLITTEINGGVPPGARTEHRFVEYTFPALLFGLEGTSLTGRDGSARVRIISHRRSAVTRTVSARVEISYGALGTLTLPAGLFSPRLNDLIYEGIAFNIMERNVLNDTIPALTYTSGTENPQWPFFTETYSATASVPSATEYQAKIDATDASGDLCIGSVIRPWKAGLERQETTYVKAQ